MRPDHGHVGGFVVANLLRFRSHTRTVRVECPDGTTRTVKVMTNDAGDVQHVEDGDRMHGHVIPAPVAIRVSRPATQRRGLLLRNMGMPKARQRYEHDHDTGLWRPEAIWLKEDA